MTDQNHLELGARDVVHDTALDLPRHAIIAHGPRRKILIGLTAIVLLTFIVTIWSGLQRGQSIAVATGLTLEIGPPPPVDAVILQAISAEDARKANASQPFVTGPIPAARPFTLSAPFRDVDRAVDCLAANIFYEAGNEHAEGQMAVAQVVINRMRHPAFPKTICGVVFQGAERRTGCQFTFTCDGSLARQPSPDAWERHRALARSMLFGNTYPPIGLATHYHTDWVRPVWSREMDKLRAERTHLFFRWSGYWGSPKAFSGKHAGTEPVISRMALLSSAHRTSETDLAAIMASLGVEAPPLPPGTASDQPSPRPYLPPVTAEERAQNSFFIRLDPSGDPALLTELAIRTCGTRDYCKLIGWTSPAMVPKGSDMSEAQQAAIAFSYLRNREQGFEKALWNCATFPRPDKRLCMKKAAPPPLAKPAPKPDMKATEEQPH